MFSGLHKKALRVAGNYKQAEVELIGLLQEIEACHGYSELGYTSLFTYVNQSLGLSEACSYQLIVVSRKSKVVPELLEAIARGDITVSKAKVIASVIFPTNQKEWIEKATCLSTRALEKAVADSRPSKPRRDVARPEGQGHTRMSASFDEETMLAIEHVRELLAQKRGRTVNLAEAIQEMAKEYVSRHDPVAKADRNHQNARHVKSSSKHSVHHRDRGCCQYRMPNGKICGDKNWTHLHHIKPRSEGGDDTPDNLITICAAHHRMIHAH